MYLKSIDLDDEQREENSPLESDAAELSAENCACTLRMGALESNKAWKPPAASLARH